MSDYCTGCKHLGKLTHAGKTSWKCAKHYDESGTHSLMHTIHGNPVRLFSCRKNNWYKSNNKKQGRKMALKELSVKEALLAFAEKYPEPVEGWFWYDEQDKKDKSILNIDTGNIKQPFKIKNVGNYPHFAIEVPDEYRYMTQQEVNDFISLNTIQTKLKSDGDDAVWASAHGYSFNRPSIWIYRTIKEIDGKIVYGEPMEFKVRVEN